MRIVNAKQIDAVNNKLAESFMRKNIPILSFIMAHFRSISLEEELFELFVKDSEILFTIFPYLTNYIKSTISIVKNNNTWFDKRKEEFANLKL